MTHQKLENYLYRKLADLDHQTDMHDLISKGRFSFGLDQKTYGHLPAWQQVAKRKKHMVKMIWVLAIVDALLVVCMASDFSDRLSENWIKAVVMLIVVSGMAALLYFLTAFYSLFVEFRKTEREVRKLIYQDILFELKKEEKAPA